MTVLLRVGLAILAFAELVIGGWNLLAPEHFYAVFPGVALTPPFAEHYARDFGGATVGLGIILGVAAAVPRTILVVPALIGLSAFTVPHVWFHLHHLHDADGFVFWFTVVATVAEALAPLLLLALAIVRWIRMRGIPAGS